MSVAIPSYSSPDPFRLHVPPPTSGIIFDNNPEHVLDLALCRLQTAGIRLVEWQDLVYRRMGVPACIKNYCYLVPDALVPHASQVLTDLGLPLSPATKFELTVSGDFAARAYSHRITRSTCCARVQHLMLYPQSFATLVDAELEEHPPSHVRLPCSAPVLVPTAPAVYASILRMMLQYDRFDPVVVELSSQLSELIGYHLLGLKDGYIEEEDWERWEVDRRIEDAVHVVRAWGMDQVWRDGEQWMGDALAEMVKTGGIEHLPTKPRTP
ncbi:hypothetical protein GGX14DRAFT_176097 [Mycena pura]|uniref:Uncharacterized protein n=1 Tax=Mycena pura TaxID=153505 RepID=A0AAD6YKT0_9AGAR|nr:hypothetical protein GGX14DRAFT_176097 [Mycena pura]